MTDDKPTHELLESNVRSADEWGFVADVRTRIENPNGSDVIALRTFKARPKHDDLTSDDEKVHEHVEYWWPNSYPAEGDEPFDTSSVTWDADLSDDDALLDNCITAATFDAQAELDSIAANNERHADKLTNDA